MAGRGTGVAGRGTGTASVRGIVDETGELVIIRVGPAR